jgi:hypothetical protein
MTVIDFIKTHKNIIVAVVIIVLLLCFLWKTSYSKQIDTETEESENIYEYLAATEQANINAFLNKPIYLKYNKSVNNMIEPLYLSVVPKSSCSNFNVAPGECLENVAVLQKSADNFASFKLIKSFSDDRYRLVSNNNNKTTMNKNYKNNIVCFDNGDIDDIYFEIERNNGGQIRLKYRSPQNGNTQFKYYYVAECKDSKCTQLIRVCLSENVGEAINFNMEEAPKVKENFCESEMSTNIAVYNEEESNISGIEATMLGGFEKFMSL